MTDVRLPESKKAGLVYASNRFLLTAKEGESVTVKDSQNTDTATVDSLSTAFDLLKIMN